MPEVLLQSRSFREAYGYRKRTRSARGEIFTVDYRAEWPGKGGIWRVALVRAMSPREAVEKVRTWEKQHTRCRLTQVHVERGNHVHGYHQGKILY